MGAVILDADGALLLLVDLQERLVPVLHEHELVVARAVRLAQAAQRLGVPVRATEQNPQGLGPTVASLRTYSDDVLQKTSFSAGRDPAFSRLLPPGTSQVVVAGSEAHVCVLQTVLMLLGEGRRVAVVSDAIGSRDPADKAAALERACHHGGEIVTSEMVLFEWLRDATHPQFREVHRLLK